MKKNSETADSWTYIIKPKKGWFDIHLAELWRYKDLIGLFVRRDFVAIYKQTILGPLWFIIQPLFTTVVFTIVFGNIAKISTDGLPQVLFYFSGTLVWNYFSTCLTKTADTFSANQGMFGKVYFPRLTVPISVTITNLITFAIQFAVLIALIVYFKLSGSNVRPNMLMLTLPLLLIQMAALGLGVGIIISSLTTKYRDLHYLVGFGVQLWMYATPIVYPISEIPERWRWLILLNPMTAITERFREAFLGAGGVTSEQSLISAGMTLLLLAIGIMLFSRVEKTFMDTV